MEAIGSEGQSETALSVSDGMLGRKRPCGRLACWNFHLFPVLHEDDRMLLDVRRIRSARLMMRVDSVEDIVVDRHDEADTHVAAHRDAVRPCQQGPSP